MSEASSLLHRGGKEEASRFEWLLAWLLAVPPTRSHYALGMEAKQIQVRLKPGQGREGR